MRWLFALSLLVASNLGCFEDRGRPAGPSSQWICTPADDADPPGTPGDPDTPPSVPDDPSCPAPSCPSGLDAMYVSGDPMACAAIEFDCPEGEVRFDAPCGCGCRPEAPPGGDSGSTGLCPEPGENGAFYLGEGGKVCETIDFTCPDGQERFDGPCGCGCWNGCPDPEDPRVHYLSEDPEICELVEFTCPADCVAFDDGCGCGCIEPEAGAACPDPDDPTVLYVSTSTTVCSRVNLNCPGDSFDDACGCGCLDDPGN